MALSSSDKTNSLAAGRDTQTQSGTTGMRGLLPGVIALLYLLLVTFPAGCLALEAYTLDHGWMWALNYLFASGYVFGRDALFTYGPLGFLLAPLNVGSNFAYSAVFRLVIHVIFAATLFTYLRATKATKQFVFFCLLYAAAFALGFLPEFQLIAVVLLLCYLPSKLDRPAVVPAFLAGALAAFLIFLKFNLGLSALLSVVLAAICWRMEFSSRANRSIAVALSTFVVTAAVLAKIIFRSPQNLWLWLRGTIEVAGGYSDMMSLADPSKVPIFGIVLFLSCLVATGILLWKRSQVGYLSLISAGSLLLAFKHGFIRQDEHELAFFIFVLMLVTITGLACRTARASYACYLAAVLVAIYSIYPFCVFRNAFPPDATKTLLAETGVRRLSEMLDMGATARRIDLKTESNNALFRLPPDLLQKLKGAGSPAIGTLPNCVGYCPANGLTWSPLPVLQLYNAYTPYLDKLCADYFDATGAPRFVVYGSTVDLKYDFGEIDHRNPFLESPLTALSILRNYRTVKAYQNPDVLLLERRKSPLTVSLSETRRRTYRFDEAIAVPPAQSLLLGSIKLHRKPVRYLLSKLYQCPPLLMEVYWKDKKRTYRMTQDNLDSGLLLNCFPTDIPELAQLMSGNRPNQVLFVRLTGPGRTIFDSTFEINWVKASLVDREASGRPG